MINPASTKDKKIHYEYKFQPNRTLDLKLGYNCNDNCIHCIVSPQRKATRSIQPNCDLIKKTLLIHRAMGYNVVIFTGGEPSLYPNFLELVLFAWKLGYFLKIQTNGRKFNNPKLIQNLSFAKNEIAFTIALHGPNDTLHDRITRRQGSFKETCSGINNLIQAGFEVYGKTVISKINFSKQKETIQTFVKLGIYWGMISFPHAENFSLNKAKKVVPSYKKTMPYVYDAIKFQESYSKPIFFNYEAIPFCLMPDHVIYCQELMHYKSDDYSIYTNEKTEKNWLQLRKQIKKRVQKCSTCIFTNLCEGPWAEYIDLHGENDIVGTVGNPITISDWNKLKSILEKKQTLAYNLQAAQRKKTMVKT